VTSVEHQDFARKAVEESTILLKNEKSALPLEKKIRNECFDSWKSGW
jgi:beta-glucosidase-like glycosyl hydrolase